MKQQNGKELGHEPLGRTVSPTGAGCKGFSQRPDVVSRFSCRISTNCSSAGDNIPLCALGKTQFERLLTCPGGISSE